MSHSIVLSIGRHGSKRSLQIYYLIPPRSSTDFCPVPSPIHIASYCFIINPAPLTKHPTNAIIHQYSDSSRANRRAMCDFKRLMLLRCFDCVRVPGIGICQKPSDKCISLRTKSCYLLLHSFVSRGLGVFQFGRYRTN